MVERVIELTSRRRIHIGVRKHDKASTNLYCAWKKVSYGIR